MNTQDSIIEVIDTKKIENDMDDAVKVFLASINKALEEEKKSIQRVLEALSYNE